ncbi:IS3 family transposase, partial [Staphylococcus canis]
MENFFGLLKQEMFYGEEFNSYEELELEIHKYINYYNNVRRKVALCQRRLVKTKRTKLLFLVTWYVFYVHLQTSLK